jgi:uncharacterized membrane protein
MAKKIILLLLGLLVIGKGFSQLYGDIYEGDRLTRLDNVLIKVSGPSSSQFLTNKTYSLDLERGNYTIKATHYTEGKIDYISEERVSYDGAAKKFDLLLIPNDLFELTPKQNSTANQTQSIPKESQIMKTEYLIIGAMGIGTLAIIAAVLFVYSKRKKTMQNTKDELPPLKQEEREVLKIISENEGKIYQKELREILNYSEAKMSILIGELEKRGEISREKIGRDNLLKTKNH